MDDLKKLAALTALNQMMRGGHLSICTIDKIAKLLNVHPPAEPYGVLSTLHCVDWKDMPQDLRQAIPGLIEQCLTVAPTHQFNLPVLAPVGRVVDIEPPKERGMIRRLLGNR